MGGPAPPTRKGIAARKSRGGVMWVAVSLFAGGWEAPAGNGVPSLGNLCASDRSRCRVMGGATGAPRRWGLRDVGMAASARAVRKGSA
eukprot:6169274-Alexandrium_andersonii.AAC.1